MLPPLSLSHTNDMAAPWQQPNSREKAVTGLHGKMGRRPILGVLKQPFTRRPAPYDTYPTSPGSHQPLARLTKKRVKDLNTLCGRHGRESVEICHVL
jgi:hypothetical protein